MQELLKEAINKVSKKQHINQVIEGRATEVTNTSCTVKREDGADMLEVLLNAVEGDLDSFAIIIPAEGSEVLVGVIEGNRAEGVVLRCSEVEKIIWKNGTTELEFTAGGWDIKRGNESLKKILYDLLITMLGTTANTNVGPTLLPLINASDFLNLQNRLDDLFL